MATIQHSHRSTGRRRRIGPIGTTARLIVGGLLLGSVVQGHLAGPFRPAAWALGLLGFPALLLGWQWLRARRTPTRLQATGPVANVLNVVLFLALYLTPAYAPVLSVTSDAALLFYGASMLLAALRGYAGCEVLAVSNWLLGRDDQVGCLLFWPIDHAERRRARAGDVGEQLLGEATVPGEGRGSLPGHPDGGKGRPHDAPSGGAE